MDDTKSVNAMSTPFEAAYETWRQENDTRRTREMPCLDLATTVEMPAFQMPANEEETPC